MVMNKKKSIAPFILVEHEDSASLILNISDELLDLFSIDAEEDFNNDGYDWEALAKCYHHKGCISLTDEVGFDSESSMFCMYSSNISDLISFGQSFRDACFDTSFLKEMLSEIDDFRD